MIKRGLLFVIVLAGFIWTGLGFTGLESASSATPRDLSATQPAVAALELENLEGGTVRLADLRGKVVLVDFWATWCPPRRAMIPSLNRLQAKHDGKGLVIAAISMDQGGAEDVLAYREWFRYLEVGSSARLVKPSVKRPIQTTFVDDWKPCDARGISAICTAWAVSPSPKVRKSPNKGVEVGQVEALPHV